MSYAQKVTMIQISYTIQTRTQLDTIIGYNEAGTFQSVPRDSPGVSESLLITSLWSHDSQVPVTLLTIPTPNCVTRNFPGPLIESICLFGRRVIVLGKRTK